MIIKISSPSISGDTHNTPILIKFILEMHKRPLVNHFFLITYLVKSIDFLLAFNVVFVVSKNLKSVQKRMQLTKDVYNRYTV